MASLPKAPPAPFPAAAVPALSQQDLKQLVEDYFRQLNTADERMGTEMRSELVRVVFEILINLSYVLFGLGLALGIKAGFGGVQRLVEYVSTPGHEVFLALLLLVALIILSIAQVFAKSKALSARAKRDLDFVVDLLRTVLYVCVVAFFGPFVFSEPEETLLIGGFWALLLAAILFAVRKGLKWYVFLVEEKDNLKPWEEFAVTSPLQLLQLAQFNQFLHKQTQQQAKPVQQQQQQQQAKPAQNNGQLPSKLTQAELDENIEAKREAGWGEEEIRQ